MSAVKERLSLLILVLLLAVPAGGCGSGPDTAPPTSAPTSAATPAPLDVTPQPVSPSPAPSQVAAGGQPPVTSKPTPDGRRAAVPLPRRIQIPKIKVDAGFESIGLTPDKALDSPKDPDRVGWYKDGPRPGEKGNSVLAGHVDWGQKVRVFWGLKNLAPGDAVVITDAAGGKHEFVVTWARWYDWNAPPTSEIFGSTDRAEITMITCGGDFDRATRNYLKRLVVKAELR